jgi:hypothetical protein
MPIPVISQNPGVVWSQVIEWPILDDADVIPIGVGGTSPGRFNPSVGWPFGQANNAPEEFIDTTQAAGGATAGFITSAIAGQGLVYQLLGLAAGSHVQQPLAQMKAYVDQTDGSHMAAGSQKPDIHKAYWLSWTMRSPTAAPDNDNGVILTPINNRNNHPWPTNVVGATNTGGVGFVGDGAGQWVFASFNRAGAPLLRTSTVLPAHTLAQFNSFELFITNTRPGLPATLDAWFNGTLVASLNWQGADLEPYAANETNLQATWRGGNGGTVEIAGVVLRRGKYTRAGIEL